MKEEGSTHKKGKKFRIAHRNYNIDNTDYVVFFFVFIFLFFLQINLLTWNPCFFVSDNQQDTLISTQTEFVCCKQDGDIYTLNDRYLKFVD